MSNTSLSFRPMTVGAEVIGFEGFVHDPGVRAALYEGWLRHGILLFRNVATTEQHMALSRCFGELELHPFPEVRSPENPLLIEIGGTKRGPAYVYDDQLLVNRIAWHRDTAYTPDLCKGAMLRMVEIPRNGGETLFADTAAAYDGLPPDMKTRLDALEYKATLRYTPLDQGTRPGTLWKTVRRPTAAEDPGSGPLQLDDAAVTARYPSVIHPAVLVHPESGRRCLFLSPTYVDHFLGLESADSDGLLEYLVSHMVGPRYVYTHRWSVNDAIIWDNRRFMHAALGNLPDQPRRGLRTTLAGSLRSGRYVDSTLPSARAPALAD